MMHGDNKIDSQHKGERNKSYKLVNERNCVDPVTSYGCWDRVGSGWVGGPVDVSYVHAAFINEVEGIYLIGREMGRAFVWCLGVV